MFCSSASLALLVATQAAEATESSSTSPACAPDWSERLRRDLEKMAAALTRSLTGWRKRGPTVTPEMFGHSAPSSLATAAIQAAIDHCAKQGGGTVSLAMGDYVSGTLDLRSNVRLHIDRGSRLLGSTDLKDYPTRLPNRLTVMDSNMGMNQSLIFALDCENICISGRGTIDFRGTRENFPGPQTTGPTPGRPFGIRVLDCRNVHIKDITLKDAACWMQNYLNCEDLLVEGVKVHNQSNYNNDAIDIDSCRRVIVRNCVFNSEDDALCFKGAGLKATENVLVENCEFYSTCNAIKFGTDTQGDFRNVLIRHVRCGGPPDHMPAWRRKKADSGISWEIVDGGVLENVYTYDVDIQRTDSPLFIRLADRGRVRPEMAKPGPGTLRRVVFEKITGSQNGARGSYFMGISDKRISDIVLKNVHIKVPGSQAPFFKQEDIGEYRKNYPDAKMIKGLLPAYGLWARNVEGLTLIAVRFEPETPDLRPEILSSLDVERVCRQAA